MAGAGRGCVARRRQPNHFRELALLAQNDDYLERAPGERLDLKAVGELPPAVEQKLQELGLRPDVHVNRVVRSI